MAGPSTVDCGAHLKVPVARCPEPKSSTEHFILQVTATKAADTLPQTTPSNAIRESGVANEGKNYGGEL
jgi:hypothetical protein